jgi:lipoate-protein ligase A
VLNYSLILRAEEHSPLASISGANQSIMQRNAAALTELLGQKVEVQGHTDLALNGRKFSGNAQRRKRTHLLFHGSILLNLDFKLLEAVMPMPTLQPDYRNGRSHRDFLTQISPPASSVRQALRNSWGTNEKSDFDLILNNWRTLVERLVVEKYSRPEWNLRV